MSKDLQAEIEEIERRPILDEPKPGRWIVTPEGTGGTVRYDGADAFTARFSPPEAMDPSDYSQDDELIVADLETGLVYYEFVWVCERPDKPALDALTGRMQREVRQAIRPGKGKARR